MHNITSPRADDDVIEQELKTKSIAPRVTPTDIELNIVEEHYFTAGDASYGARSSGRQPNPLDLLTFCVLVLRNGFTVTGESACASPENFDADIGRKIARKNAVDKLWPLMGYELKSWLHRQAQRGASHVQS